MMDLANGFLTPCLPGWAPERYVAAPPVAALHEMYRLALGLYPAPFSSCQHCSCLW